MGEGEACGSGCELESVFRNEVSPVWAFPKPDGLFVESVRRLPIWNPGRDSWAFGGNRELVEGEEGPQDGCESI